jgi:integrase
MPKKLPPHVQTERTRHGKVVFYFRRAAGSPRIRLPDLAEPGFKAAYAAALAGSPIPATRSEGGTLEWLVDAYKRSAQWANLKPSTRRMRDYILQKVVAENGKVPFRAIGRKHINEGIDRRKGHAGNNFRKVMSQMFTWALSVDLVETNPAAGATRHNIKSAGFHVWTLEEVARFIAMFPMGSRERLTLALALFTGLRCSDLAVVGRQHVRNNVISIRTQKTGTMVYLPVFSILQATIDATPNNELAFIVSSHGKPFGRAGSLGSWFAGACKAAGVPGRLHGLRKAGATIAADSGATPHQLMAMFGWTQISEAERYTREADRKRGAAIAAGWIENAFLPHPAPEAPAPSKTRRNNKRLGNGR